MAEQASISFIIAAFNATATLGKTLDSLIAQTRRDWEAVVVDDGSTDATADLAADYGRRDSRIRLVRRQNGGAAAARNTGVDAASARLISLLDADDWVDPQYVKLMLGALRGGGDGVVAYCSYRRVSSSGSLFPIHWTPPLKDDPVGPFTARAVATVHCYVFPRRMYLDLGGMDPSLRTCEDWDLWVRIVRSGARFVEVRRCLAFYRTREGSLTTDLRPFLMDALTVLERMAAPDPRIANPSPPCVDGIGRSRDVSAAFFAVWLASTQAMAGEGPDALFALLPAIPDLRDQEEAVAGTVIEGLRLGLREPHNAAVRAKSDAWSGPVEQVFELLERASSAGLKRRLWVATARFLACKDNPPVQPWKIGSIFAVRVDLRKIEPVEPPHGCDTGLLVFTDGEVTLSVAEIPVWGIVAPAVVAEIAIDSLRTRRLVLLGLLGMASPEVRQLVVLGMRRVIAYGRHPGIPRWWRGVTAAPAAAAFASAPKRVLAAANSERAELAATTVATVPPLGSAPDGLTRAREIVDQLVRDVATCAFPRPHKAVLPVPIAEGGGIDETGTWLKPVYEQVKHSHALSLVPDKSALAMELACGEGNFTAMLAPKVKRLIATDGSEKALRAAATSCSRFQNIEFRRLDFAAERLPSGLDLIVCSEVLYDLRDEGRLREVVLKLRNALAPGGHIVAAHSFVVSDAPRRTAFDWDTPFGATTILRAFAGVRGLTLERAIETDLYTVCRYRCTAPDERPVEPVVERVAHGQPLDQQVARDVVWGGAVVSRSAARRTERATRIPVLMYHRISSEGPEALARYRTSAELFDAQMRLLRRYGYETITSQQLTEHLKSGRPFRGRPVLLTFDDGYRDFATEAFPILRRYGMNAEVFIVTEKVGTSSDWDAAYGPASPLMDWDEIGMLYDAGIAFGSHMATHRRADSLSSEDLLREAARSKAAIEARLGGPVTSMALPYGAYDPRVIPVLRLCGYEIAFSTVHRRARLEDQPLCIPRIEVRGDLDLSAFAAALEIPREEGPGESA